METVWLQANYIPAHRTEVVTAVSEKTSKMAE